MATSLKGPIDWWMSRDEEGHREYHIVFLVKAATTNGPANVLRTAGLPVPGSLWSFFGDSDFWAWFRPTATVRKRQEYKEGEAAEWWTVEMVASTKPPERNKQRCQDVEIEDPLLEPAKVSGSAVKFVEEATHDRFGGPIVSSSHEQLRGPQVEFDNSRTAIRIEQNVPSITQAYVLPASLMNTVNALPLWGFPERTVKLSGHQFERRYYGNCFTYYNRVLEFEIQHGTNSDGTAIDWDRDVLDEGTKALMGHWDEVTGAWVLETINGAAPNPENPAHFKRVTDREGNPMKVILDGTGKPYNPTAIASVLTCNKCAAGAPTVWIVNYNDNNVTPNTSITSTGLCNWAGGTATLTFNDPLWELTSTAFPNATWTQENGRWNCLDTNEMVKLEGDGPDLVILTPQGASEPGSIFVSKYPSGNFLLLGIPLVF